ncbi:MAG: hypothetical protein KF758_16415 [Anaerolineales bacterium]|nr:hypothetical protein [Anaerolineales bacterium]
MNVYNRTISNNILKIILFFLIAIFVLFGGLEKNFRRLFDIPKIYTTVDNENSILLSFFLDKDSFSGHWQWDLISTFQTNEPFQSNDNINEYGHRKFVGHYENHKTRVSHSIVVYSNNIDFPLVEPTIEMKSIGIVEIIKTYPIIESNFTDENIPTCFLGYDGESSYVTRCILVLEKENIFEKFDIDIYTDDTQLVLEVYNDFLNALR